MDADECRRDEREMNEVRERSPLGDRRMVNKIHSMRVRTVSMRRCV
jgi:hypothetical protein